KGDIDFEEYYYAEIESKLEKSDFWTVIPNMKNITLKENSSLSITSIFPDFGSQNIKEERKVNGEVVEKSPSDNSFYYVNEIIEKAIDFISKKVTVNRK